MNARLALGTAQFGLTYGIANTRGKVDALEGQRIIEEARRLGINTLDTAIAYGESEASLGRLGISDMNVVTKLPRCPSDVKDVDGWVTAQVRTSLNKLRLKQVSAVLLHQPDQLLGTQGKELFASLQKLKSEGITKKIGISVYTPSELELLCEQFDFQVVQAPLSVLDRRLVETGWAEKLKRRGIELHTRSAFLQGLLLMNATERPAYFGRWNSVWAEWHGWLSKVGVTPLEACLKYVLSIDAVDRVIVGVDSLIHLQQIYLASGGELSSLPKWPSDLDTTLLNPGQWSVA